MGNAKNDLLTKGNAPDFENSNFGSFHSGTKTVTVAGTAELLSATSKVIPSGYSLVIKALKTNTTKIRIAASASDAQSDSTAYVLQPQETVTLNVTNVNLVYIDAATSGEGATYIVEKEA